MFGCIDRAWDLLHGWEKAWRRDIKKQVKKFKYIDVSWVSSSSVTDETEKAARGQVPLITAGYIMVGVYIFLYFMLDFDGGIPNISHSPPGTHKGKVLVIAFQFCFVETCPCSAVDKMWTFPECCRVNVAQFSECYNIARGTHRALKMSRYGTLMTPAFVCCTGPFIAIVGYVCVLLSVAATFGIIGILSLSPMKTSPITLQIVPLLMVGLGVNDFFVIASYMKSSVLNQSAPILSK